MSRRFSCKWNYAILYFFLLSGISLLYKSVECRNILAVFPYEGPSHQMMFHHILRALLKDGNNITTFTSLPMKEKFDNHHQFVIKRPTAKSQTQWGDLFEYREQATRSPHAFLIDLEKISEDFLHHFYLDDEFQRMVSNKDLKFDLVLLETFFMQEGLLFLGHRFGVPVVTVSTTIDTKMDHKTGRPRNPALDPEWGSCIASRTTPFTQRLLNTLSWLVNVIEHKLYYWPKREENMKRFISYPGMETLPPLEELMESSSLNFVNSHPLVQFPTPRPPNVIDIPGLHIANQTLPKEFQSLMDSASEGVVLFTFGSNIPLSKMKEEKEIFIRALGRIPHLVLCKSDSDIENLPKNVKVFKWLPQQAILAHKNCRAFLTHGGMLGKQEAVYFGVPTVTVPFCCDQFANAGHSEATGLGLSLNFLNITEDAIVSALSSVINDKSYKERLEKYSKIFREDVSRSTGKILHWMEHIAKYDGADYLRRQTKLYWFQYYLLDVFAFIFVVVASLMFVLIKTAQTLTKLTSLLVLTKTSGSKSNKPVKLKTK